MNYKRIIPSRNFRLKLLRLTEFIPDKTMIKLQYRIATGRKLNFQNLKRFSEKLQWYKLYYRDPLMSKCADKYNVREYVTSKGLKSILVPLYGVYDRVEDINFEQLPGKFVLKTSNGSQTNILCENKDKLNEKETLEILNDWLNRRTAKAGREWAYYNIKPKIICEELLEKDKNNDLIDYKFVCFNGSIACIFVNAERESENGLTFDIYDKEFKKIPYKRKGIRESSHSISKPENYEEMIKIVKKLSTDFPHVRVDLYNVDGKIYFGEMTFYHASGYFEFEPDKFDYVLGDLFNINC